MANGQQTANNLANLGQNYASNVGNNLGTAANARASSYANTANSWNNAANQLGNIAGQYYQKNGGWAPSGVSTGSYGSYIGGNGTGNYGMQLRRHRQRLQALATTFPPRLSDEALTDGKHLRRSERHPAALTL